MPESLIRLSKDYFENMEDGTVILEQMQALINLYPEKVQANLWRFSELKENSRDFTVLARIRENVKKPMFPIQWSTPSEFFMTTSGIKNIVPQILMQAIEAYNNGGISSLKSVERRLHNPYDNLKLKKSNGYIMGVYDNGTTSRQTCVTCETELSMYVEAYRWLSNHPDFEFGEERKTLSEYGLCDRLKEDLPDFKDCVSAWILDMEFANSEEDINWEMVHRLFKEEKHAEMMQQYFAGKVDASEIFDCIGFKSNTQAIACFSKKAKLATSESKNLGPALKRVKMFGVSNALASDVIYVALFKHLVEFKPEVLSNQLIRLYATAF
jgi:hypothetical protein